MKAAVETLMKAFVEASIKASTKTASTKTASTEASVEAFVEATPTEVYLLLVWKLVVKNIPLSWMHYILNVDYFH